MSVLSTQGISDKPKKLFQAQFIEPESLIVVICKNVGEGLHTEVWAIYVQLP